MIEQLDRIERKLDSTLSQMGAVVLKEPKAELYDEHGVSYEKSKTGGFKLKEVEIIKDKYRAMGGKAKIAAESILDFFNFLRPNITLTKVQKDLVHANQEQLKGRNYQGYNTVVIDQMREIEGIYEHAVTGEKRFKLPSYHDDDYKNWFMVQSPLGKAIENNYVCVCANWSNVRNPRFKEQFFDRIPAQVEQKILNKIASLNDPTRREHPIR